MLTTYTENDLRARAAAEAARRERERAEELKAQGDALLLSFHLTGSPRLVDELAARGQRDLFRDL